MTAQKNVFKQPVHWPSLLRPVLIGAGIALVLIIVFLSGVDQPKPEWPKFWQLKPLIVVTLAGAAGGAFYYIMGPMRYKGGWQKIVAIVVCLIVYVIGLWLGTVLGLNGTLWN
jgi:hypothetical protein